VGISWLATKNTVLIGQIQGNLNAFKEIDALNQHPLSIHGGFRYSDRYFTEASIGLGLNEVSADFTLMFSAGTMF
jgi:hypothetical protein